MNSMLKLLTDFTSRYGLNNTESILDQPLDSLSNALIDKKNIFKVEMSYDLFNGIEIKTNHFNPVAMILDKNSGKLFGLNESARVVELTKL